MKMKRLPSHVSDILAGALAATIILSSFPVASPALAETDGTIIEEWASVQAPPPPELKSATVDPKLTALLILDIQNQTCNSKRRPRCVASLPKIKSLLAKARAKGMTVIYSLTGKGAVGDIRKEVPPLPGEPVVKASVNKFFGTDLEKILKEKGIKTVILVGTAAHGAVLHTATGAAARGLHVIVPVDGMSADLYAEQSTAWHLVNGPGTRSRTTLTRLSLINF